MNISATEIIKTDSHDVNKTTTGFNSGVVKSIDGENSFTIQLQTGTVKVKLDASSIVLKAGDELMLKFSPDGIILQLGNNESQTEISDKYLANNLSMLKELESFFDIAFASNGKIELAETQKLLQIIDAFKQANLPENKKESLFLEIKTQLKDINYLTPKELSSKIKMIIKTFEKLGIFNHGINKSLKSAVQQFISSVKQSDNIISIAKDFDELTNIVKKLGISKSEVNSQKEVTPPFIVVSENNTNLKSKTVNTIQLFSGRSINPEIRHLLSTEFNSQALTSISTESFKEILSENGELNLKFLKKIDSALQTLSKQNTSIGSSPISQTTLKILLPQLLSIMGETIQFSESLVSKQAIVDMFGKISPLLSELKNSDELISKYPQIKEALFGDNNLIEMSDKNKKQLIFNLVEKVGLNRESKIFTELLSKTQNGQNSLLSQKSDLKSLLLEILFTESISEKKIKSEKQILSQKPLNNQVAIKNKKNISNEILKQKLEEDLSKRFLNSTIKDQISRVIEKIESYQILAKPIQSSRGDTQLITIPIEFAGEWSELHLNLHRRKKGNNSTIEEGDVSVRLNIELSVIGEVSANIEYFKGKKITINVVLQNRQTAEWFNRNRSKIKEALSGYGLLVNQLNFRLCDDNEIPENTQNLTDRFDLKG